MAVARSYRGLATMLLSVSYLGCAGDAGPRPPAVVQVADGDGQIAPVGTLLPAPIVATVLNQDGAPAAGVRISWRTADGRVLPVDAKTDAQGRARARWELGESEGQGTAEATLPGAEPAVFTAIAEPRDALPLGSLTPLTFATYDGSGQVVSPDSMLGGYFVVVSAKP